MANGTARPRLRLRYDSLFFSGMAGVALIAILVGFARTYFLAGLFRAPLPNLLVQSMALRSRFGLSFSLPRSRWSRREAWIFIVVSACSASCSES
jgi:hypothetical protein